VPFDEAGPVEVGAPRGGAGAGAPPPPPPPPRGPRTVRDVDVELLRHLAELRDDVLPLADAQEVEVLGLAEAAERRGPHGVLLLAQVLPEVEVAEEVGRRVGEPAVELVGLLAALGGAFARVLDGQGGGDDRDLVRDAEPRALDDHAGEPGVHGEAGEGAADVGEVHVVRRRAVAPVSTAERAELGEELDAVAHGARVRGFHEGELGDVVGGGDDPDGDHLEQHGRERGPQDLRFGELGAGRVVVGGVQADRDAVGDTAGAAGALVRGRLADGLDGEPLHLGRLGVAGDAGGAGVDDVVDAGHRQ
jgi:hypothetical protein